MPEVHDPADGSDGGASGRRREVAVAPAATGAGLAETIAVGLMVVRAQS